MEIVIDANNQSLHDGSRVYTYDFDGKTKIYGTLRENEFKNVSEWYVAYDDGNDCAVLDFKALWKA